MEKPASFVDLSYALHEQHIADQEKGGTDILHRLNRKNNVDHWIHDRIYSVLLPLIDQGRSWMTIGDGFGTDANWLEGKGATVTATDISDTILKKAHDAGFIQQFSRQNAEHLSLPDNSVDFVLCKEAYHHFPRPYLAIYEMLRVCRQGMVLIEPQDPLLKVPLLLYLKNILYKFNPSLLSKIWKNQFSFEPVGNYVYKVSEREIEKVAMGMGLPAIAFKGVNYYYENNPLMTSSPPDEGYFRKIKRKIAFRDMLGNWGIVPHRLLCCVIFKTALTPHQIAALEQQGYQYLPLPKNPYSKA